MAEIANSSLTNELKLFGRRAWELGTKIEPRAGMAPLAETLRKAVAEAPRRLARAASALEPRKERHELHCAFRALTRAVDLLDEVARTAADLALEALALAQEGAELSHEVYERVA